MTSKLTVVRYQNRKLYCKELSRYVSLIELVNYVCSNESNELLVRLHNNTTDITASTLLSAMQNVELNDNQLDCLYNKIRLLRARDANK